MQVSGLPMHIIQRGNNRQACLFLDRCGEQVVTKTA
jgi:hypothetical protein